MLEFGTDFGMPDSGAMGGGLLPFGVLRRQFRLLGIRAFRLFYPRRQHEIADIFGSNGHDVDGTHIDVSFRLNGRRIRMLPLGVFTPPVWLYRRRQRWAVPLHQVCSALKENGFRIHRNDTESMQIHCDYLL